MGGGTDEDDDVEVRGSEIVLGWKTSYEKKLLASWVEVEDSNPEEAESIQFCSAWIFCALHLGDTYCGIAL